MIEIELTINELKELYNKEKSIRKKVFLESAISALKSYDKLLREEE